MLFRRIVWGVIACCVALGLLVQAGRGPAASAAEPAVESSANQTPEEAESPAPATDARTEAERQAAIRRAAAVAESAKKGAEAVPELVQALADEDADVRRAAIQGLAETAPARADIAVPALIRALDDDGGRWQKPNWILASQALGRYKEAALPALMDLLKGDDPKQAAYGCLGIYEIGPAGAPAVPRLIELLEKDDPRYRRAVIGALMSIGPASAPAVPLLRKQLFSEDFHTQYWSCRALGAIGAPAALEAVPDLIDRLKNGAASVKRNAAAALGRLGPDIGTEALQALIEAVDDPVQPVREQAIQALGRIGPAAGEGAATAILESHRKRPVFPASVVYWALWRMRGESQPAIDAILRDLREGTYRDEAMALLLEMGPAAEAAIPALRAGLTEQPQDFPDWPGRAAWALRKLQAAGFPNTDVPPELKVPLEEEEGD
ncbi:MAG: HEAT repeat domain-containing protein [Thermogutta sp.]|nr:HEAT repeat domain-containing protein [Thermogutta sp.]